MDELGRILTVDEVTAFLIECQRAEKALGPLSREERILILKAFGRPVTHEDLADIAAITKGEL